MNSISKIESNIIPARHQCEMLLMLVYILQQPNILLTAILPELELTAGENDILREDGGKWLLEELIKVVEESTSELTQYLDVRIT
jgi:hypothetical protein